MLKELLRRLKEGKQVSRSIEDIDEGIQDIYVAGRRLARTLIEIVVAVAGAAFIVYKAILPPLEKTWQKVAPQDGTGIEKIGESPSLKTFRVRGR